MTGALHAPPSGHNGRVPRRSKPEKYSPSWFWPLGGLVVPFIRATTRLNFIDDRYLPERGSYVLAPNHYTEVDPFVIAVGVWRLGRAPRFLTKASLFKLPMVGWMFTVTGQIPVERAALSRSTIPLKASMELVDKGRGVVIYPEGTLTREPDMWPMRGKTGAVRLALEHDLPLIPMAQWGAQGLLPRYGKKLHPWPRSKVDLKFGPPVDLSQFKGRPLDAPTLNAATEVLMQHITALLEELRGEKAPPGRWDPKTKGQTETGRFD